MENLAFIIIFTLLIVFIFFLKSPKTKGAIGELRVRLNLGNNIPNEKYVINDLLILHEGKSHQIDHLIIRKTGVFIIETKNYAGLIYGDDKRKEWTQVLNYGKIKHKFYNPVLQNKSHIYTLSKIIGRKDCFISIIVFPKADIMTYFNERVGSISDMKRWLKQDRDEILTSSEIDGIYQKLIDYKNNPKITNKEHIDNIYRLRDNIENNICPRCGKTLVLRQGRYNPFYGCSGYPYCKFVKNSASWSNYKNNS